LQVGFARLEGGVPTGRMSSRSCRMSSRASRSTSTSGPGVAS
jgi:hypothetical protein